MPELPNIESLNSLSQQLRKTHDALEEEIRRNLNEAYGDFTVGDFVWEGGEDDLLFIGRPISPRALQLEATLTGMYKRGSRWTPLKLAFLDRYGIPHTMFVYEAGLTIQVEMEPDVCGVSKGLDLISDITKVNAWNPKSFDEILYDTRLSVESIEQEIKALKAYAEYHRKKLQLLEQAAPVQNCKRGSSLMAIPGLLVEDPYSRDAVEPPYSRDTSG